MNALLVANPGSSLQFEVASDFNSTAMVAPALLFGMERIVNE
jgi:hypothetical protein